MSKKRRTPPPNGPGSEEKVGGGSPGKRTRTAELPPAVGPSANRVVANPARGGFAVTEISKSRLGRVELTNVSTEPLDF